MVETVGTCIKSLKLALALRGENELNDQCQNDLLSRCGKYTERKESSINQGT